MTVYVAGFLFRNVKKEVALIQKLKPEWQMGFLNGIGGKVETSDETFLSAMTREFMEEAGVYFDHWEHFCTMKIDGNEVHFYRAECGFDVELSSPTAEQVGWYWVDDLPKNILPNLKWLVPMAREETCTALVDINNLKGNGDAS